MKNINILVAAACIILGGWLVPANSGYKKARGVKNDMWARGFVIA